MIWIVYGSYFINLVVLSLVKVYLFYVFLKRVMFFLKVSFGGLKKVLIFLCVKYRYIDNI